MSIIEVQNVSFSYDTHHVLSNLSLRVERGDFLALLGSNGTGKTTLLKILLDELKPTNGTVLLYGQNVHAFKDWTKFSYLAQNATAIAAGFPTTVKELVASNLHAELGFFRILNALQRKRVKDALNLVGMGEYQNRLFSKLSGGQMQKVMLARCLVNNPEILLLDEPTSALDETSTAAFFDLLRKIALEQKTTIIVSTHSQICSKGYCDKILNLDQHRHEENQV